MPLDFTDLHDNSVHVGSYGLEGRPEVRIDSWEAVAPDETWSTIAMTPDQAEDVAAKLVHSAAVARYFHAALNGEPVGALRVTLGPRGRIKLAQAFLSALARVLP